MTKIDILQAIVYFLIILIFIKPLGWYMARVYEDKPCGLNRFFRPLEKLTYRLCGIRVEQEMDWKKYLTSLLAFNFFGLLFVYLIQRIQIWLPLNPEHFSAVSPDLAFNTAASFVTNTNWQAYGGENTLSYFTQMTALTVQNFLSAATGMSLLVALIRGLVRHESNYLGNFWVDTVRGTLYILLPLSFLFAIGLTSQGVIQNFNSYEKINLIQPVTYQQLDVNADGKVHPTIQKVTHQIVPMGPVASQIAIKQLGTNGGGFFNTNSAHPFENPTPATNLLEMIALLLIPAALCYTFGLMINDKRQGWAILAAMFIILLPCLYFSMSAEKLGNPALAGMGLQSIENMEGKEVRFGAANSAMWATLTTATSNGSVNSMHDSFTPLGGLISLWLMQLGEVVFGGAGSGLYGMLILVIVTVFVAGLMVGRTPEYLGKKIEPFEMKMASLAVLIMPCITLICTALAAVTHMGTASLSNPGAHGLSELLYAFSSMGNNNGSAFAGLNANTPFYNIVGGLVMLISRYWIAIPTLAIAGSLARKKIMFSGSGTLPTHTPLFIVLLIGVTIILGALTFLPALSLGPIVEQLTLWGHYGH